jgi:hypothetical protein
MKKILSDKLINQLCHYSKLFCYSRIDKYERRFFHLPAHKSQNVSLIGKYLKKRNKKIKIINGLNNDSEDSDSEMSCMKKIKESPPKNRIK